MAEDNSTSRHFADSNDSETAPARPRRRGAHFSEPSVEQAPAPARPVADAPELEWGANDPFAPKADEVPADEAPANGLPFDGKTSYQPQGTAQAVGHVPVASPSTVPSVDHPGDTLPRNPLLDAQPRVNTDSYAVSTPDILAVPDAPLTPQQEELGATGPNAPVRIQVTKGVESSMDAPRPITVDPSSSGTFRTIGADEGAVLTTRDTAAAGKQAALSNRSASSGSRRSRAMSQATFQQLASSQEARAARATGKPNNKVVLAILLVAVLIGAAGFLFFGNVLNSVRPGGKEPGVEQAVVDPGSSVAFGGYTYSLSQDQSGAWSVVRKLDDGTGATALFALPGTPFKLVLWKDTILVPENLADGWDVMVYTIADGSEPARYALPDGTPVGGQGTLADVRLEGDTLTLTDADGQPTMLSPVG
jgi:hypothetical protein